MPGYEQFFQDVREEVGKRIARFGATEEELDSFLKNEEDQIKGEYEHFSEGQSELSEEARYKSAVNGIAYCLEMCY